MATYVIFLAANQLQQAEQTMTTLRFDKISGSDGDVQTLYHLLSKRKFGISHQKMPSYDEHKEFVQNHPYRAWYLVHKASESVGTCYVMDNNCISVFLTMGAENHFNEVLDFILNSYDPLEEIKSVRPPYFYINVPEGNTCLMKQVADLGWKKLQTTFACIKR
jgi:hypothetical protein